jgi:hypothetical protein
MSGCNKLDLPVTTLAAMTGGLIGSDQQTGFYPERRYQMSDKKDPFTHILTTIAIEAVKFFLGL